MRLTVTVVVERGERRVVEVECFGTVMDEERAGLDMVAMLAKAALMKGWPAVTAQMNRELRERG